MDQYFTLLIIFEVHILMRNVIFRIYPSGSCQYPITGQQLIRQMKAKNYPENTLGK